MTLKLKETKPIALNVRDTLRGLRTESEKIDTSRFRPKAAEAPSASLRCIWCGKPVSECPTGGRFQ